MSLIDMKRLPVWELAADNAVMATHCRDCGEEIPDRRRELVAGCQRCADCQEEFEERGKHLR
ncbi:TPA: TraR/DksA C4-type zinc finger protein [Klebsiella quasipneumoniae]|nr:TraR/DksA C4-type zinc finger protein [Klebsiella quasipneumoniae]HCA6936476.1 TraR/DksA C4-type zinc finger protein [Klebsiella quasipneumoniae]HEN7150776.1 TraR/DksA C4-type zinc finger protein [Klebsiella quasipneumoniae]